MHACRAYQVCTKHYEAGPLLEPGLLDLGGPISGSVDGGNGAVGQVHWALHPLLKSHRQDNNANKAT